MTEDHPTEPDAAGGQPDTGRPDTDGGEPDETGYPDVVVVPPDGAAGRADGSDDPDEQGPHTLVDQPAKVMRIGTMIKQLLDEVKSAPLDDAARERLAEIHEASLHELEDGLSPELIGELRRITLPLAEDRTPSDAELRIAQAQLVGWLEGLFHGIQTALVAQQMAAQAQLSQMRRALPPGPGVQGAPPVGPVAASGEDGRPGPGQYL